MMTETELTEQFMNALSDDHRNLSFVNDFVSDMACYASEYDDPKRFFEEIQHGGYVNGMISILIYTDAYKRIADMKSYIAEKEDEYGCSFENTKNFSRYVFVCWLCYKLLADEIYTALFE